eukprot:c13268_g1_i2 orf=209-394(-)
MPQENSPTTSLLPTNHLHLNPNHIEVLPSIASTSPFSILASMSSFSPLFPFLVCRSVNLLK